MCEFFVALGKIKGLWSKGGDNRPIVNIFTMDAAHSFIDPWTHPWEVAK